MVRILRFAIIALFISVGLSMAQTQAPAAAATDWKGKGKMGGKVFDEAQKPIAGVTVKFVFLPANAGPADVVTNVKGEWKVENIADGMWSLELWKQGFDPKQVPFQVGGKAKDTFDVKMTKEGTDPTFAMRNGAAKAQAFFDQQKYSDSRAVYQDLLTRYPSVPQLHQYIARDYHMEKNYTKAIEELQACMKAMPTENQVKLMLASELTEAGRGDEAWTMYATFDTTVLRDALDLETPGFMLLRAKKPVEALKYFERVVVLYPDDPQAYYYRGLTNWQIGATVEKVNSPESKAKLEAAKTDLTKFMGMVPNAGKDPKDPNFNNFENAKKMLEPIPIK